VEGSTEGGGRWLPDTTRDVAAGKGGGGGSFDANLPAAGSPQKLAD
jgi:hypothetical protein